MPKKEEKQVNKNKTTFIKGMKAELKKVIWPTPKQLFNNTAAVLVIMLITAIIVFVLDFAFEGINKYGLDKIKQSISNSSNADNISSEEDEEENNEDADDNQENVSEEVVNEDNTVENQDNNSAE